MKDCCGDKVGKEQVKSINVPYRNSSSVAGGTLSEYILDGNTHKKLAQLINDIDQALHQKKQGTIQLIFTFLAELDKIPEAVREQIENTLIGAHSCQLHVRSAISSVRWQLEAGELLKEIDSLLHSSNPNLAIPKILSYLDLETRVPNTSLIDAAFNARQGCAGHLRETIEAVRKQALAQLDQ